ncbi:MAG: FG-GAP repeat protein, partial [Anaerolineae bacterium]
MKDRRQPAHRYVFTSLTLILTLLLVAPGLTPAATARVAPPVQEVARVDQPDAGITAPAGLTDGEWTTMQDLIRQAQYQFAWQVSDDGVGAYRAPNRAHGLSLSLAADGFHAARYSEGEMLWEFGLSLAAYGEQTFPAAIGEDSLVGGRERVEYHWSRNVVEWYVNSAEGVEHGLTLAAPPAGADGSSVELAFALRGSLMPELDGEGGALRLKDASGRTVLRYDQLTVYDAMGRSLNSYFFLSPEGEGRGEGEVLHLIIDTAGAVYPLTVDPLIHAQVKKLAAFDAEDGDRFGSSVAISGDTVVVGVYREDGGFGLTDRGAAYIFVRNKFGADIWGQAKKLLAWDGMTEDYFGYSVAISGDTVVVGAPYKDDVGDADCVTGANCGAAYIFERNQGGADNWGVVTRINAFSASDDDHFGWSVAISNDTVIVGARDADIPFFNGGAAFVFERNHDPDNPGTPLADNWGLVAPLAPADPSFKQFGHSVAISGDTVVVGAWQADWGGGSARGAAFVFVRNKTGFDYGADNWWGEALLIASDGEDGDQFGNAVAISGDTIVVGAYGEDGTRGNQRGAAYVFERNRDGADVWGEVTKLAVPDAENLDFFGDSVAISGDTIVVGAWGKDGGGSDRGAAYVFERNRGGADGWGHARTLAASDAADEDSFGGSVAISGDTIVVGAPYEDGAGTDRGAAYVFVDRGGRWQEIGKPHASDAADEDRFGYSVTISGDTAVVGADWWEGSSGSNMGAAYVLER